MSVEVLRRRGTTLQHSGFIGGAGEITVDTDKQVPIVHDGSKAGGFPIASGVGTVINLQAPPYSCDPTGGTDVTSAVQSALDILNDGDAIYGPAGIYKISSGLSVVGKTIKVFGDGYSWVTQATFGGVAASVVGTVFKQVTAGEHAFAFDGNGGNDNHCVLRDFAVWGPGSGSTGAGLHFKEMFRGTRIDNVGATQFMYGAYMDTNNLDQQWDSFYADSNVYGFYTPDSAGMNQCVFNNLLLDTNLHQWNIHLCNNIIINGALVQGYGMESGIYQTDCLNVKWNAVHIEMYGMAASGDHVRITSTGQVSASHNIFEGLYWLTDHRVRIQGGAYNGLKFCKGSGPLQVNIELATVSSNYPDAVIWCRNSSTIFDHSSSSIVSGAGPFIDHDDGDGSFQGAPWYIPVGVLGTAQQRPVGVVDNDGALSNTTGTTEETVWSYTLPAYTCRAAAHTYDVLDIYVSGITAYNSNSKTIKLKIGSTTIIQNDISTTPNGQNWFIRAKVWLNAGGNTVVHAEMQVGATNQTPTLTAVTAFSSDMTISCAITTPSAAADAGKWLSVIQVQMSMDPNLGL